LDVDLLLLSRDLSTPRPDVWTGIMAQRGVRIQVHRVVGAPRADDVNRYQTIARARNEGKRLGKAPWVMLLDDDVVLGPDCVARLVEGLQARPVFAVLAADSDGNMTRSPGHWDYPRHVGMAAVLFRREQLEEVEFRWETGKCECLCCCEDLRRDGHAIGYLRGAEAWHRPRPGPAPSTRLPQLCPSASKPGRILAAFDRKHYRLFIKRFLATLRRAGNRETVTAVVSNLYPRERQTLSAIPGVEVVVAPGDAHPSKQRLRDFHRVIADWPDDVPVAYWDAGDVVFQGGLEPLWELARKHPDRLLAASEWSHPSDNVAAKEWVVTIRDFEARRRAMELFMTHSILNAGFAAGTAIAMRRYLKGADELLRSDATRGSTDWGDQTTMNLFCHSNPDAWLEVSPTWNYCLVHRPWSEYRVTPEGYVERRDGEPVHVAHGAGGSLRRWDLVHLTT
jgi:Glycosyl transferase family 2